MADKLLIVMANSDPAKTVEVLPPLSQAIVAAAMEFEVEVIFTGGSAKLVQPGRAKELKLDDGRSVYDVIKEGKDAGVSFKVCAMALAFWGEDLIPEIDETVGDAYLISEAMADETVTFTY